MKLFRELGLCALVLILLGATFLAAAQPVIITQPTNQLDQSLGSAVSLRVLAQDSNPLRYQWRLNGVNLSGATNRAYTISSLRTADCGNYTVAVSDPNFSINSLTAEITPHLLIATNNDLFVNRTALYGLASGNVRSSNKNATKESKEDSHAGNVGGKSIWFKWTAPGKGIVTFTTSGSSFDTVLAAYTGKDVKNLKAVPSSVGDDDSGGFLTSKISFNADTKSEYEIAVDGFNGASGDVVLSWNEEITSDQLPKIKGKTDGSKTVPPGAPIKLDFSCDPSQVTWFFNGQATANHATNLFVASASDTTIGNYVAQAASSGGHKSSSQPAHIQINVHEDGSTDDKAAALDKFQDATDLAATSLLLPSKKTADGIFENSGDSRGYTVSQFFSTVGAAKEPGEPNHCGQAGGASMWFTYQPTISGTLNITTEGSTFNTILAVYTGPGDSFATLTNVNCGYTTNYLSNGQPHLIIPNASSTTTYYIVVDGFNGASGVVHLNINSGIPIRLLTPPQNQTVVVGSNAVFTVTASGSTPVKYQWCFNGISIANATNSAFVLTNAQSSKTGDYSVVVSNAVSTLSTAARLNLQVPASAVPIRVLSCGLTKQNFLMQMSGSTGAKYISEYSTNLVSWFPFQTNTAVNSVITLSDTNTAAKCRFYRTRLAP